ncbi:MAG: type II toxin-antitoxin system HicA family toxin [Anaerolineales bacterium]|nr:type II toxin-antitoxin system HicA family toxin [Anaerolineales bacterium]
MPKLRPAKPQTVQRVLEKLGFQLIRQSGNHAVFRHPDGRWTTVPLHPGKDVAKGTL